MKGKTESGVFNFTGALFELVSAGAVVFEGAPSLSGGYSESLSSARH